MTVDGLEAQATQFLADHGFDRWGRERGEAPDIEPCDYAVSLAWAGIDPEYDGLGRSDQVDGWFMRQNGVYPDTV